MALTVTQQAFVDKIMPYAQEASRQTGIDPRIIVAQAAHESAWGRAAPGNNFFGIKGPGQTFTTHEYYGGQKAVEKASFRTYDSPQASVQSYANLMSKPFYEKVREAAGLEAQAAALGKSGYATDPRYGALIKSIAEQIPLVPATNRAGMYANGGIVGGILPGGTTAGGFTSAAIPSNALSAFAGLEPRLRDWAPTGVSPTAAASKTPSASDPFAGLTPRLRPEGVPATGDFAGLQPRLRPEDPFAGLEPRLRPGVPATGDLAGLTPRLRPEVPGASAPVAPVTPAVLPPATPVPPLDIPNPPNPAVISANANGNVSVPYYNQTFVPPGPVGFDQLLNAIASGQSRETISAIGAQIAATVEALPTFSFGGANKAGTLIDLKNYIENVVPTQAPGFAQLLTDAFARDPSLRDLIPGELKDSVTTALRSAAPPSTPSVMPNLMPNRPQTGGAIPAATAANPAVPIPATENRRTDNLQQDVNSRGAGAWTRGWEVQRAVNQGDAEYNALLAAMNARNGTTAATGGALPAPAWPSAASEFPAATYGSNTDYLMGQQDEQQYETLWQPTQTYYTASGQPVQYTPPAPATRAPTTNSLQAATGGYGQVSSNALSRVAPAASAGFGSNNSYLTGQTSTANPLGWTPATTGTSGSYVPKSSAPSFDFGFKPTLQSLPATGSPTNALYKASSPVVGPNVNVKGVATVAKTGTANYPTTQTFAKAEPQPTNYSELLPQGHTMTGAFNAGSSGATYDTVQSQNQYGAVYNTYTDDNGNTHSGRIDTISYTPIGYNDDPNYWG